MSFWSVRRKPSVILQREGAECLLACIAMLASAHHKNWDLAALRRLRQTSARGANANDGLDILNSIGFSAYATSIDVEDIEDLRDPVILHWCFNHYVVLAGRTRGGYIIIDPALGRRIVGAQEFGRSFTGVAIIADGAPTIVPEPSPRLRLSDLIPLNLKHLKIATEILGLTIALQASSLLLPLALKRLFDYAGPQSINNDVLKTALAAYLAIALYGAICGSVRQWAIVRAEQYLAPIVSSRIFDKLLAHSVAFVRRRSAPDLASRFGSAEVFRILFSRSLVESFVDSITLVAVVIAAIILWPELSIISIAGALCYVLLRLVAVKETKKLTETMLRSQNQFENSILETLKGFHVVAATGAQAHRKAHWLDKYRDFLRYSKILTRLHTILGFFRSAIPAIELTIVLAIGVVTVKNGMGSVGALVAFMAYRQRIFDLSASISDRFSGWKEARIHFDRLDDIWNPSGIVQPKYSDMTSLAELRDVSYGYPGERAAILNNVSIGIPRGELVAIVGKTGSGKSTLLGLVLGHLAPISGEVVLCSSLQDSFSSVSVVFQDDVVFSGTVSECVALGDIAPDAGKIESVLSDVGLLEEILSLPMGLESIVGENGTFLSGGQRQRLLIARALYSNPKLLVLDEATANLDVATERAIIRNLKMRVPTILVVAHRPELIELADTIIEVERGQVCYRRSKNNGVT